MSAQARSSDFQTMIESVQALPPDDQLLLIEIIRQQLIHYRRSLLVSEVAGAREAYRAGNVHRGSVDDLFDELLA